MISSVYEKINSKKIGYYVPGTRIPIKSDKFLFKKIKNLKVIVNFAWHIKKEIKFYLKINGFRGKIVNIVDIMIL